MLAQQGHHGTCEGADFVHIRTGRCGKRHLDGLNAVTVGKDSMPLSISTRKPIPPSGKIASEPGRSDSNLTAYS